MASDHVLINRAGWDADAPTWIDRGRTAWASTRRWPSVEAWKARKR